MPAVRCCRAVCRSLVRPLLNQDKSVRVASSGKAAQHSTVMCAFIVIRAVVSLDVFNKFSVSSQCLSLSVFPSHTDTYVSLSFLPHARSKTLAEGYGIYRLASDTSLD